MSGNSAFSVGAVGATGKILQVVFVDKTDTFSTTSTSFTNVTGISASITPSSASNKILVFLNVSVSNNTTGAGTGVCIRRGSTELMIGDVASSRTRVTGGTGQGSNASRLLIPISATVLDSPSTTAPVTYNGAVLATSGTTYVNRTQTDSASATWVRGASSITLLEVEG